ncbi:aldo/keto reductase [Megasphaera hexanoica]|nr:aldo/keto reductase [Megasphaera hexanoica]
MHATAIPSIILNNGVSMPILGLGIYALHGTDCERAVCEAVALGYRLFDTAQMYGNERELGNALKACGVPREELFITTKLYSPTTTYKKAKAAIIESLKALQTDYIDLLLIHEPYSSSLEMYKAMTEAYEDGKIRALGISNFSAARYLNFIQSCGVIPAVNQVEAHAFYQQKHLQAVLEQHGTQMEAWSPFAAGKNQFFSNLILQAIGKQYGKTAAQVGLRLLVQRGVVAIPKSGHADRLKQNLDIFDFSLSDEDLRQIQSLEGERSLFGWYD